MKDISIESAHLRLSSFGSARERSPRKIVGLVLSVLAHALVLWMIIFHKAEIIQATKKGADGVLTMIMTPEKAPPPAPAKVVPPAPKTTPRKTITSKDAPPIIVPEMVAIEPAPAPPAKVEPIQEPEQDMAAMIEAARKKRNQNRDPSESEETDAQRANRIAKANIAIAGNAGNNRNKGGGVFEVRHKGVSSGEFVFNGWSRQAGRNSSRLFNVRTDPSVDIEVAMVRKVIEVIRTDYPGEFSWDSYRLGRVLTLNAGQQYQDELVAFFLKELFPEYVPSRRG